MQGQRPKDGARRKVRERKKRSSQTPGAIGLPSAAAPLAAATVLSRGHLDISTSKPEVSTQGQQKTVDAARISRDVSRSSLDHRTSEANSAGASLSALSQCHFSLLALQSLASNNTAPSSSQFQSTSQTPSNIDPGAILNALSGQSQNFGAPGSLLGNHANQYNIASIQSVSSQVGLLNQAPLTNLQTATQLSSLLNNNAAQVLLSMNAPTFPLNNFNASFPQAQNNLTSMQPSQNQVNVLLDQIRQQNEAQESQSIIQLLIQLVEQELRNRIRK
jgi:hypothetical protein